MQTLEVFFGEYPSVNLLLFTERFPRKTPWKLSPTRKANARSRLKKVDAVIEAVKASGVQCGALVGHPSLNTISQT
jgi:hypothetical protein